jgi:hypothetical protein
MIKIMVKPLLGLFILLSSLLNAAEEMECSQEILYTYFPRPFVEETMIENGFSQKEAQTIADSLAKMDQKVTITVEQKAQEKDPNPLMSLDRQEDVVQIFKETLLEVFSDVLKQHGKTDSEKVQAMLDAIQEKKALHFAKCLEEGSMPEFPTDEDPDSDVEDY